MVARGALRTKFPDATARRVAIDAALSEGAALDPFGADGDIAGWLADTASSQRDSTETLILTSEDPDDLTLRQARQLASATTIYHSADVPAAILNRARADATRVEGPAPDQPGNGLTLIVSI